MRMGRGIAEYEIVELSTKCQFGSVPYNQWLTDFIR